MKYLIELEKSEVDALLQLIDIAVGAARMQVAEAAVVLTKKIAQAPAEDLALLRAAAAIGADAVSTKKE